MKLSIISIYVLSTLSSCIAASPVLTRRVVHDPTIVSKVRPADDATPLPSLPFQYLRAKSIDCPHQHGFFADGKPIWLRSESNPAISDQSHFLFLVDTSENQWMYVYHHPQHRGTATPLTSKNSIATAPKTVSIRADKIPLLTTADAIFYRQYYERYGLLGNLVPGSWCLCPQGMSADLFLLVFGV